MPRKNARPAAKKAAAKAKARVLKYRARKSWRRIAIIGHHTGGHTGLALAAIAAGLHKIKP